MNIPVTPDVVGVVLSYNSLATLPATLHAASHQTVSLRSLIVVDNASSDGTQAYLDGARSLARSVVLPENTGVGGGHNAGWRAALAQEPAAEFLWVLEHDSVPSKDCLERLLDTYRAFTASGHRPGAIVPRQIHPEDVPGYRAHARTSPYLAPRMTFNASLVAAEVIREVGFVREDFFVGHEDREYAWRLTQAGFTVVHDPGATVIHRNKGSRRRHEARSILRDYYSARNELFLRSRIRKEPLAVTRMATRSLFHIARVVIEEDHRTARIRARFRALFDGARGNLGPQRYAFLTISSDR